MRVLLDTDVVLDVVLAREPFAQSSVQLFKLHEQGKIDVFIAAITPINVFLYYAEDKGWCDSPITKMRRYPSLFQQISSLS